jgi:hypothetical protein
MLVYLAGGSLAHCAILSASAAVGGYVNWMAFSIVSRRFDDSTVFLGATFGLLNVVKPQANPLSEDLNLVAIMSLAMIPIALILGWLARVRSKAVARVPSGELWDPELDH